MERRYIENRQAHIERRADGDTPIITGYASLFYDGTPETEYVLFDNVVERIMPSAFDRALAEKDDVRGLFNHDPDNLLGRTPNTMTLSKDDKGLRYDITAGTSRIAQDVIEFIERGDLTGSSFAFVATDVRWRETDDLDIREIHSVELYDVGPVTYPAYESTTAGMRSVCDVRGVHEELVAWKTQQADARLRGELTDKIRRTELLLTRGSV